jgi:hypothetical protein
MEKLTPVGPSTPAGLPYVVGLCHDLADIVLRQHFCDEYARVLELTGKTGRPQRSVESAVFGMPYTELVSVMLSRLGLPSVVTDPIQEFFTHANFLQPPASAGLISRMLRFANVCSHGMMLAPGPDEWIHPLSNIDCRNALGEVMPSIDIVSLRADALRNASALAELSESQSRQLSMPDIAPMDLRLCYVRHRDYSVFDPLHMLLQLIAGRVTVVSELPIAADLGSWDAVVWVFPLSDTPSQIMSRADQAAALTCVIPLPVLLLSPAQPSGTTTLPKHIQIRRLPSSIQAFKAFLTTACSPVSSRAA